MLLNKMVELLGIQGFDMLDTDTKIVTLANIFRDNEILFVIDNADSLRGDRDFRRLLAGLSPTPRGRLMLTSRQAMGIDGEKCVDLYVIGRDAAIQLFLYTWSIDSPTEEQIGHVAAICGRGMLEGHPLAIFTAASLARKEMNPNLTSLRERLRESIVQTLSDRSTSEEEVSVEASLRISWDALDDNSKSLLSRLSVYRLPFREEAIAAIVGDRGDWHPAIVELQQHQLVMRFDSRYYLHPVVQSFAERELKSPEEMHRMAGAFLIDTEYLDEYLEAIDHFEIAGEWRRVVEGVSNIVNRLHREGYWGMAHTKLEQGLRATRELGDKQEEASMLGELGTNHDRRCEYRKAIEYGEQALAIFREVGDRQGESTTLGNLGLSYESLGDVKNSIEYHEHALAICREIGDRRGEGSQLANLASLYRLNYDLEKVLEKVTKYYEQALAISREVGDRVMEGNALGNLGNFHAFSGDGEKAIKYCDESLLIARALGYKSMEGSALSSQGMAYISLGDISKGIEYTEQGLAIFREIGDKLDEGACLSNLGKSYIIIGDTEKGLKCLFEAQEVYIYIESPRVKDTEAKIERLRNELGETEYTKLENRVRDRLAGDA